ncbi:sulfatase [Kutzneria sp. NPDC052558]|uniref:sulfatase n=1 Tax=Kutzneria sp. NPDC052558 TaxID=3364121 RepID=UPI0037C70947
MRAIMVMFDSLNRRFLPPYGNEWVHAPHFTRLARRTVTFDTCYAGSMPCMPARREMHTARHNFLHRSWGPLEPFDDSVPEMLADAGVYTHIATDHPHYWEDGGATYHTRFRTHEFFRGQEGDPWKGQVADPPEPCAHREVRGPLWRQDLVNRQYLRDESDHPQTRTVDAGIEFIEHNREADRWFLQIECFDPHEPFFTYDGYRRHYPAPGAGPRFDWPDYRRVDEPPELVDTARHEYAALLSMCDRSLGRVLDAMDRHDLWPDTALIVCTDHGLLLGEHGWWGKNVQPWYDENIHTPLFVWDPRSGGAGERRAQLVQTIDFGPILLDLFGVEPTPRMAGRSIAPVLAEDRPIHESALFGSFGGHVNVTDGRHVYMRGIVTADNQPLHEHTLMPTHMNRRFDPDELRSAELVPALPFTRGVPVLRVPGAAFGDPASFGTVLFDLHEDPEQLRPVLDDELELRMIRLLLNGMRAADAPDSQYLRLGLPRHGPPGPEHLLARRQHDQYLASLAPLPEPEQFRAVNTALGELLRQPGAAAVLHRELGPVVGHLARSAPTSSLVALARFSPALTHAVLHRLDELLAEQGEP